MKLFLLQLQAYHFFIEISVIIRELYDPLVLLLFKEVFI